MYLLPDVVGCKCRKPLLNKYIHSFWVTNGAIKLKAVENRRIFENRDHLEKLFPDNEVLARSNLGG